MTDARHDLAVSAPTKFGDILRRYRERAGLSQEELAERAGLSAAAISALERGIRNQPHPTTLRRLADALGLSERDRHELLSKRNAAKSAAPTPLPPPGVLQFPARGNLRAAPHAPVAEPSATNLPAEVNRFVGRREALADVSRLLIGASSRSRLLTLTGAGGCGKTRLALRAAGDFAANFRDGVWLVELAPVTDPDLVVTATAAALGIRGSTEQTLRDSLLAFLRSRQLLLVLDNCEHLIDTVATLAASILRSGHSIRLLATSREPLRIDGETTLRVPSLAVPDASAAPRLDDLAEVESVGLFLDRATATQPDFALTTQNAPHVAEICRRLDGIPLAIELAARQVKLLGVEQIAQRIDQRFALLTLGSRAALPRQQTLAATIDWSYELLSDPERRLFEHLSVFAGSFSLEAAEAVGKDEGVGNQVSGVQGTPLPSPLPRGEGILTPDTRNPTPTPDVLHLLANLVDKSIVVAEAMADGGSRFSLLETLRQYGWEKLGARDEDVAVQRRHALYYSSLAQNLAQHLIQTYDYAPYAAGLTRDVANVRVMLRWYLDQHLIEEGWRALGATSDYWHIFASREEGLTWYKRYLAAAEDQQLPPIARAGLLRGAAWYSIRLGDLETPLGQLRQAIALAREAGNPRAISQGFTVLGWLLLDRNEFAEAEVVLREGLSVARQNNVTIEIERAFLLLGDLARRHGDLDTARASYQQVHRVEKPFFPAWAWRNLAYVALHAGDLAEAEAALRTSLAGYEAEHNNLGFVECLAAFAALAAARNATLHAAELVGAMETGLRELAGRLYFGDRFELDWTMDALRARLPANKLAAALERGRQKTVRVALAEALANLDRGARG